MIKRGDLFHLSFYKKSRFTGSCRGMRYCIAKADREDGAQVLRACVYPEPYNFENTPEEEKSYADFEFSEAGLDEACDWLNGQYEADSGRWQNGIHLSGGGL